MEDEGIRAKLETLTPREWEVLMLGLQKKTDSEISESLCITKATVRQHFCVMYDKFEIKKENRKKRQRQQFYGLMAKHKAILLECMYDEPDVELIFIISKLIRTMPLEEKKYLKLTLKNLTSNDLQDVVQKFWNFLYHKQF